MQLTILVDNQATRNLQSEWGLSIFIEADGKKILLDTGASHLFWENAVRLQINLADLDFLVLSHGHWDHTWGLAELIKYYLAARIPLEKRPALIAHPLVTAPRFRDDGSEFGIWFSAETLRRHFKVNFSKEPYWLTENLVFLGEIERKYPFENRKPLGKILTSTSLTEDYLTDDSALAYKTPQGLVVITGCSHSGICNIIEQARNVCKDNRIIDVIGGFHLQNPDARLLQATTASIAAFNPGVLHPCHCTDFKSKAALAQTMDVQEVAVGRRLEYL